MGGAREREGGRERGREREREREREKEREMRRQEKKKEPHLDVSHSTCLRRCTNLRALIEPY